MTEEKEIQTITLHDVAIVSATPTSPLETIPPITPAPLMPPAEESPLQQLPAITIEEEVATAFVNARKHVAETPCSCGGTITFRESDHLRASGVDGIKTSDTILAMKFACVKCGKATPIFTLLHAHFDGELAVMNDGIKQKYNEQEWPSLEA